MAAPHGTWKRPATAGQPAPVNRNAYVHRNVHVNQGRDLHYRRNTYVRPAPRPYARPPYVYGGHRYYAYHPYAYHAYRPYYWDRGFLPFGAFVTSLAATAIVIDIANTPYAYADGVWYAPVDEGYDVVTAPVGAFVPDLPSDAELVAPNIYYYGGAYYQRVGGRYRVVAPWAGLVVSRLPPGGEEIAIGGQRYVRFGATYYQPVMQDGQYRYEVVEVR